MDDDYFVGRFLISWTIIETVLNFILCQNTNQIFIKLICIVMIGINITFMLGTMALLIKEHKRP